MSSTTPHTYRKTATVKAMQWDGTGPSTRAIIAWAEGKITRKLHNHAIAGLIVHTLEGPLEMNVGDWALQGNEGEFWPNRGDIFALALCDHWRGTPNAPRRTSRRGAAVMSTDLSQESIENLLAMSHGCRELTCIQHGGINREIAKRYAEEEQG